MHQFVIPAPQKKYAFNPLADKPIITDVTAAPIAPWGQAVIAKALPPAIYHLARPKLGDPFTRDLGVVFQQAVGRQLTQIAGDAGVIPGVSYGSKREPTRSCDWFVGLPDVLLLIECKARQPIESLRTGSDAWLDSIKSNINRGIVQLNRSNQNIRKISEACPKIDPWLHAVFDGLEGRTNPLLEATWNSIELFQRLESLSARLSSHDDERPR